jgi:hypothetical protein
MVATQHDEVTSLQELKILRRHTAEREGVFRTSLNVAASSCQILAVREEDALGCFHTQGQQKLWAKEFSLVSVSKQTPKFEL